MSDWSEAKFQAAEAEHRGYKLVQPFAYIMLECPTCACLVTLESWHKHFVFHYPIFDIPLVNLAVREEEDVSETK